MPLAVLPALVGDIEEAFNVHFDAFRDEPIMRFLYPGGVDREAHRKGTATWWNHDRTGHHFKCVDTDTGRIVGLASWDVFWKPGDGFERPAGIPWLEGEDKARCEAVLAPIWDLRVRFFGKRRHVCEFFSFSSSLVHRNTCHCHEKKKKKKRKISNANNQTSRPWPWIPSTSGAASGLCW